MDITMISYLLLLLRGWYVCLRLRPRGGHGVEEELDLEDDAGRRHAVDPAVLVP